VARIDGAAGHGPRHWVGVVHARRAAEGIARVLVEKEHESERRLGNGSPAGELAASGSFVQRQKALTEQTVELGILGEPKFWAGLAPKPDDSQGLVQSIQRPARQSRHAGGGMGRIHLGTLIEVETSIFNRHASLQGILHFARRVAVRRVMLLRCC
jgi:hypothetical protein